MCDKQTIAESGNTNSGWREQAMTGLSRRQFGALGAIGTAAATLAACAGVDATAASKGGLTQSNVTIEAPDGIIDAFFVHPASGRHPAVICWPDIAGLREAFMMMARRTAADGYSVLVVNPYYRDSKAPQFADFADFREGGWDQVGPWRARLAAAPIMRDAAALTAWLDTQSSVDTARRIGTEGYCMGGPFTVWTAAAVPARIGAAASFHGGGLVGDGPTSPINLLGMSRASHLIAIGQNDDAKAPDEKNLLKAKAAASDTPAQIEVYAGDHGWTVLDSPVYAKQAAEKAYADKIALYAQL